MAGEDRDYSDWIRRQPCAMPGCDKPGPSEQHHPRGPAYNVGMGQRSHDWYSMPLCHGCHHVRLGIMPKAERREFEFEQGLLHRERYMGCNEPKGAIFLPKVPQHVRDALLNGRWFDPETGEWVGAEDVF